MDDSVTIRRAGGRLGAHLRPYAMSPMLTVAGTPPALAVAGVPDWTGDAAEADAHVARCRRSGLPLIEGDAVPVSQPGELLRLARMRGVAEVTHVRDDAGLLSSLSLGQWARARFAARCLRRLLLALPLAQRAAAVSGQGVLQRAAADAAYWAGVRSVATRREWQILTRSYVVLCYHRAAGQMLQGHEREDISPRLLDRQLRWLTLLGWKPLHPEAWLRMHREGLAGPVPPRRGLVLTFDDGYADAVQAALRHRDLFPHLYVCTEEVGTSPTWTGGPCLADWEQLRIASDAGILVGSHARRHHPLTDGDATERPDQIRGSIADLSERLPRFARVLAYPNGRYDLDVLDRTAAAGYVLAHTTHQGLNGAGTPPLELRRMCPHGDGPIGMLWMALAGARTRWGRLDTLAFPHVGAVCRSARAAEAS